jgi:hypothetical protein
VVRHDVERIERQTRKMGREIDPTALDDLARLAQPHVVVDDCTE